MSPAAKMLGSEVLSSSSTSRPPEGPDRESRGLGEGELGTNAYREKHEARVDDCAVGELGLRPRRHVPP